VIKWLATTYPAIELSFFRCVFGFIPVMLIVRHAGGAATLRTRRLLGHFFRGAVWALSFVLSFLSLYYLPLADAVALSFLAPLFMAVLSVPMLGERVGVHRWRAVSIGFMGILFMARPSGEAFNIGILFGIGNALLWAIGSLSVGQLTRTDTATSITFYTHLFGALILGLGLPLFWADPSRPGLLTMAAVGLLGGTSQFWATQALSYAPPAAVAPFNYTQMIWAVILGYIVGVTCRPRASWWAWPSSRPADFTSSIARPEPIGRRLGHRERKESRARSLPVDTPMRVSCRHLQDASTPQPRHAAACRGEAPP
jgi:drug/metabolite transporter (DMT)-like permease